MYSISNYFPFLDKADFVKNVREVHAVEEFLGYEPLVVDLDSSTKDSSKKVFKAYRIMPSNTLFLAELPNTVFNIFSGTFGSEIIVDIMEFDYQAVANLIEVDLVNDIDRAIFQCNGAYLVEDILTDTFINACANGLDVSSETYSEYKVLEDSDKLDTVSMSEWLFSNEHIDESYIMESALDTLQLLKDRRKKGKSNDAEDIKGKDAVYTWLDAYFSLPEGEEMKSGGREVVPLLIGPTAVFKSATVKELCKKYNYRMVDFRVAFTSRLDYSGLFQIGEVEGKKYSYACPMEEIVVCSDGFREFCKQSYQKLEDILQKGYTESSVASDGNTVETEKKYLTDEQKTKIVELQLQYKNYMRTTVLFCDEITRCFSGSTKVKLLDGRSLTMEELYNEFGTTKPFYVYSCDKDGNVVFKKAYSNGVTRRDADVVKVTLDNGSSIICTPDHRFMLRDGSYEMAMHFERGRSLMSTYFNYKNSTKTPFGSTYETFINPRDMKEYYTHREVARQYYGDTYGKLGKDGCFRNAHHVDLSNKGVRDTLSFLNYLLSEFGDFTNREYMEYHSDRDLDKYHFAFRYGNLCKYFGSFARAKDLASVYNHKVVSVEILPYKEDVYDIEVEDTHNFLIDLGDDSGVFVHNCRDKGVNGILVQLLNQKKLNDMTLNGCKFVAATNLDIQKGVEREEYRMELDMLYDVNTDLDVAYSNRFIPLKVYPNDVMDRWFEWASGTTDKRGFKGVTNIHPVVLEFLNNNRDMVYTDKPVLDAIAEGLSDNEQRTQVFPNYRTWDMLSDYLYSVDKTAEAENDGKEDSGEEKLYKRKILEGYVSKWCCEKFIPFLESKGYSNYDDVKEPVKDDVGDFLSTALETGSPAMLIGPSALGKTSRVKQYMKKAKIKTGLEPVLINVNLASKDAVDLMGMPVKQSLTEYVGGGILKGSGLDDVSKELQSVVANVSADIKYGMTDIMTLRAPDKTIKDRFVTALKEGREVILFFDEVNRVSSNTVTSAVFEVISDYRFAGVDFSNYKDKVKVVAACNMAWEGMDDEAGGYGDTGTLDPAFAARFSIYWKKNYDENDVASWIEFMESQKEEGLIDGTLIEFFKGLDTEQALKIMASVEKRTLEDAQPSTRNMLQLSKDIKSMRGKRQENGTFKAKAFNGKILFTDDVVMQFEDLILERQSDSLESHAQKTIKFLDSLLYGSDSWESLLIGDTVKVGDTSISASDIVDSLAQCRDDLKQFTLKPMSADDRVECSDTIDLVEDLAGFVRQLDINTSNKREDMFKMYLGESILGEFTKYFNNTFGTNLDEDITIEQLSDKTLIIPFMKIVQRNFSKYSGNTESIVKYCLDLCNDFMEAHGKTLPNENYAMFLTGIKDILPNADNMVLFLKRSGENLEDMYQLAEGVGDDWIIDITSDFGNKVSREDIENIKKAIKESKKSKTPKNVKYNVL